MILINFHDIFYAVEIARVHSFSKAADNLCVTESTISQRIKKLEDELQIKLFVRTTRRVELTKEGELFVEKAEIIVDSYNALEKTMKSVSRSNSKTLSIGMMTNMYASNIPKFYREYCVTHPNLNIDLQTMDYQGLYDSLSKGEIDFAIMKLNDKKKNQINKERYIVKSIKKEKMYALLPENFDVGKRQSISIGSLIEYPVIADRENSFMYETVVQLYSDFGYEAQFSTVRTGDAETVIMGVEAGDGISFGSDSILSYYGDRYSFKSLVLEPEVDFSVYLVYRKDVKLMNYDVSFISEIEKWLNQ